MKFEELNHYLAKLTGPIWVESIVAPKFEDSGELTVKFAGDTGTFDEGEILLTFSGVQTIKLPFCLLGPAKITIDNKLIVSELNVNYIEDDCSMYVICCDAGIHWWVYAQSYNYQVLPVFYGPDT